MIIIINLLTNKEVYYINKFIRLMSKLEKNMSSNQDEDDDECAIMPCYIIIDSDDSSEIQPNAADNSVARAQANSQARAQAKAQAKKQKKMDAKLNQENKEVESPEQLALNYYSQRTQQLATLKSSGLNPYPHKFIVTHTFSKFISEYDNIEDGCQIEDKIVSVAGRVLEIREASKKLFFMTVQSDGHKVQYLANMLFYNDKDNFTQLIRSIHRGDIVGITGIPARAKKGKEARGELSIIPTKELVILAPCLYETPKQAFGLSDVDTRFKQRYLDMIINPNVISIFRTRADIIRYVRRYLDDREFIEVETPILTLTPGGANAAKFITYQNDSKTNMYMRIAPELYLKELIIGGMTKVYELGRNFRNESEDQSHSPQFTAIEYYEAYADYNDMMKSAEEMLSGLVKHITGSYKFTYNGKEIDFTPPFKRVDILSTITDKVNTFGTEFKFPDDLSTVEAQKYLSDKCESLNILCSEPRTTPRLIDKMIGHYIEPECINPTMVLNHPLIMSPLAKWHRTHPQLTERFEIFVNGFEIGNAYTELNDPVIQKQTFMNQVSAKQSGDAEAQDLDEGFIKALEYGLPPTGGQGFGIDRLVMLLTNQTSIREVMTFTH
jgi:lysyl-tRNA synthetase class 2